MGPRSGRLDAIVEHAGSRTLKARGDLLFRALLACCGVAAVGLIVRVAGWEHEAAFLPWMEVVSRTVLACYAVCEFGRLLVAPSPRQWLRRRWPALVIALLGAFMAVRFRATLANLQELLPGVAVAELTFLLVAATQVPLLLDLGLRFVRLQDFFAERRVSPGAVMIVTFGVLAVAGTFLLKMPRATTDGIRWLDALFMSTSAVCVTGLSVVDVEAAFTPTGRVILLLLIQVGGLGVMTLTTFLAAMFGAMSLRGRVLLQDLINEENIGRIGRTLPLILLMTFAFEAAGAVALHQALEHVGDPRASGWFPAVFHSVSAFCNAGFSVWSGGLYDPIVRDNGAVQVIIMSLVFAGGLGFPVFYATTIWLGARTARVLGRRQRRPVLSLHARLAWVTTLALIICGAVGFWLAEYGRGDVDLGGNTIIAALFHSVASRTAGFNISPVEALSPGSVLVMIILMFIGGCPGSTAGGIKVTTFAVALLNARRIVTGRHDAEAFGRRLSEESISRALAIIVLAVVFITLISVLLAMAEPRFALSDIVFETVSAASTVGMSRGIAPQFEATGKLLLVVAMFVGRIGVLYVFFAFVRRRETGAPFRLPEEGVIVA